MKKVIITASVFLISKWLCAQSNPDNFAKMVDIMPATPNAASIIKNGMASVNQNTGGPNISIPLYSLSGQKLSTTVELSYASSGIKVDEVSGRAGMGWAINAGGVVTRTIRGKADEVSTRILPPATWPPTCSTYIFLKSGTPGSNYDAEPDLFNFNMNGHSGSFVLNASGVPVLISTSKYKIFYDFGATTSANFIITDMSGIKYYFGDSTATEKSKNVTLCGKSFTTYRPSVWYLTKIEHPNGETILFSYNALNYYFDNGVTETKTRRTSIGCQPGEPAFFWSDSCANRVQVQGRKLMSISNNYTEIKFQYSSRTDVSGDELVSQVQLFDKKTPAVVKQKFIMSYSTVTVGTTYGNAFTTAYPETKNTPYLVTLTEQAGTLSRAYSFEYNDPSNRPPRLSYSQDHWGYFNGASNTTMIPPATGGLAVYFWDANGVRTPAEAPAKKGLLKKITYPTLGIDELEYESNQVNNGGTPQTVGGLRVSRILSYNPGGVQTIKKYFYGNIATKTVSSLNAMPTPVYQKEYTVTYPDNMNTCGRASMHSNSLVNLNLYQTSPISYAAVVESNGDNLENGATETKFHSLIDMPPTVVLGTALLNAPFTNTGAAMNGRPYETTVFKNNGVNPPIALKKTVNTWYTDPAGHSEVYGWNINLNHDNGAYFPCVSMSDPAVPNTPAYDVVRYDILADWVYLKTSTETNWDETGNNPVSKTTEYFHTNLDHLQATKIETTDGENRLVRTELKYPHDFYPGDPVCSTMVTKNILTPVIEYKQTKPATSTSLMEVKTTYTNAATNNFVPSEIRSATQGGSLVSEGTFNQYDAKGNLLQYTDKAELVSCIIWGYDHLYPVAKVTNATYASAIATLTPGSVTALQTMDDAALLTELNKIRTGLPNALVTTYTYKHLAGISAMVDANNKKNSYEYDDFQRLVIVRDQDGYVVKKICYNYSGQAESCATNCTNTTANWQNTATAQRCQLNSSCAYTGYMEQEQQDINTCSPTYLNKRWEAVGSPSVCTGSTGYVSVNAVNNAGLAGYVVTYTMVNSPYTAYDFTIPAGGGVLGCIPNTRYNVYVRKPGIGSKPTLFFTVGAGSVTGQDATFYNVNMTFAGNRTITIDYPH